MARILLLTPQLPYPPQQGTSLRNFHILRALAERHEVTLLSFAEDDRPADVVRLSELAHVLPPVPVPQRTTAQRLRQLLTTRAPDMALRLRSEAFAAALTEALRAAQYDAVQIEGIELAWTIPIVRAAGGAARIVLDCHNAETELQRRTLRGDRARPARWPAAVYSALQVGRLARFERAALAAADAVIAVSEGDRRQLMALAGEERAVAVIPNMIEVAAYRWDGPVAEECRFDLVFTGKMDYRPNVDGVLWFAETIWPLVRRQRPPTTWAIVGQRPHPRLDALRQQAGISVTGRVEHVQPYLAGARVYVLPLRIGSGTRLKLIESLAAGCAVVATTIGAEGFELDNGREAILADTPETFAAAVLALLDDPERRAAMGARGQAFAAQYDWQRVAPLLNDVYDRLWAGRS
jgi:glycosyltransferase involved in cell wall biosynthesis